MKREIKFRGKSIHEDVWLYGWLMQTPDWSRAMIQEFEGARDGRVDLCAEVIPETVGQYTGLKDRNGTDVWEGDLLLTPERDIMVVEWQDAALITRCVRPTNPRYVNSLTFAYPVSEVIGNIHDNKLEDYK